MRECPRPPSVTPRACSIAAERARRPPRIESRRPARPKLAPSHWAGNGVVLVLNRFRGDLARRLSFACEPLAELLLRRKSFSGANRVRCARAPERRKRGRVDQAFVDGRGGPVPEGANWRMARVALEIPRVADCCPRDGAFAMRLQYWTDLRELEIATPAFLADSSQKNGNVGASNSSHSQTSWSTQIKRAAQWAAPVRFRRRVAAVVALRRYSLWVRPPPEADPA